MKEAGKGGNEDQKEGIRANSEKREAGQSQNSCHCTILKSLLHHIS